MVVGIVKPSLTHLNPPQNAYVHVLFFVLPQILLIFSHEYATLMVILHLSVSHSVGPLHESDIKFTDVLIET